ncbi:hypothetical protein ACJJIR_08745 [Microbulbifer sp. SSSA008]|uniref:hypothetical protein n=1 Tax=unclassified Microbulbifer TaxID=2619833 RepID=UPI0040393909
MPIKAQVEQLQRVAGLCVALERVTGCPDLAGMDAVLKLIGEEVSTTIQGVIYSAESKGGGGAEMA